MKRYGGCATEWLDLSTGISPWTYPIPQINESVWRELPKSTTSLVSTAADYYHCTHSLLYLTPGSQLALRLIPNLIAPTTTVAVPRIGYQEHAYSWKNAGHTIKRYSHFDELNQLVCHGKVDNAVVINPNNPSGQVFTKEDLLSLCQRLNGILLVDEAFADFNDEHSLSDINSLDEEHNNVVILRSLGKFFGLAGARIGFVISHHRLAKQLNNLLQPWSVNAAAIQIAEQALSDTCWQKNQKLKITKQTKQLAELLKHNLSKQKCAGATQETQGLITTISSSADTIEWLQHQLAERRIWTRIGDSYINQNGDSLNWLRLSLPGERFGQLATALGSLS